MFHLLFFRREKRLFAVIKLFYMFFLAEIDRPRRDYQLHVRDEWNDFLAHFY